MRRHHGDRLTGRLTWGWGSHGARASEGFKSTEESRKVFQATGLTKRLPSEDAFQYGNHKYGPLTEMAQYIRQNGPAGAEDCRAEDICGAMLCWHGKYEFRLDKCECFGRKGHGRGGIYHSFTQEFCNELRENFR